MFFEVVEDVFLMVTHVATRGVGDTADDVEDNETLIRLFCGGFGVVFEEELAPFVTEADECGGDKTFFSFPS